MLIDVDMVVTRPLTPLIERAAADRVRRLQGQHRPLRRRVGRAARTSADAAPARTSPPGSSSLGGAAGREVLRPLARPPGAGSTTSAPTFDRDVARLSVPLPRPGRPQRDPLHARSSADRIVTLDAAPRPHPPFRGLRMHRRGRPALRPPRRHRALRDPPVRPQAVARADVPRDLLASCCARLWLGPDVAIRPPRAARCRCGCATGCSPGSSGARVDAPTSRAGTRAT